MYLTFVKIRFGDIFQQSIMYNVPLYMNIDEFKQQSINQFNHYQSFILEIKDGRCLFVLHPRWLMFALNPIWPMFAFIQDCRCLYTLDCLFYLQTLCRVSNSVWYPCQISSRTVGVQLVIIANTTIRTRLTFTIQQCSDQGE